MSTLHRILEYKVNMVDATPIPSYRFHTCAIWVFDFLSFLRVHAKILSKIENNAVKAKT